MKAWLGVTAAALVPAALVAVFFGLTAGGVTFAVLMLAVIIRVFPERTLGWLRLRRNGG